LHQSKRKQVGLNLKLWHNFNRSVLLSVGFRALSDVGGH
jgi:hypothetical protein